MEIAEIIYKGVVKPPFKKLLGNKPAILDSLGKIEYNPPRQILTLQRMGALASAVNDM